MRKVYLDELPRVMHGKVQRIDWSNSIGYKIKFEYDNIIGEFEIVGYKSKIINVKYNNLICEPFKIDCFYNAQLAKIIGVFTDTKDYKYQIDQIILLNNSNIKILQQIRVPNGKGTQKGYKYQCLNCGTIDFKNEYSINKNQGCPVCDGKVIKIGYNDIWTTNPELAKLLANPEDGYKYTQNSSKKVEWKCPNCGEIIKDRKISDINKQKLSCPKCSDGISYPEKFMYNLLSQLNIEFEMQKAFSWSKNIKNNNTNLSGNKKYDIYIENLNLIIEVHGGQHYNNTFETISKKSLVEEKENDILKETLAINNNIDKYIVIDARYSDVNYIKTSILNSGLNILFNLTDINWIKCHEYACNSLVKKACDLWNSGIKSTEQIGKLMSLNKCTIIKYLKQGKNLNLCDYSIQISKNIRISKLQQVVKLNSKSIVKLNETTNQLIKIYSSIAEAKREKGIGYSLITQCCDRKVKSAGGYKWMYLEDYNKMVAEQQHNEIDNIEQILDKELQPLLSQLDNQPNYQ